MNKIKFIIKLSPEITIKSTPVRKRTVKMLSNNISKTLNTNTQLQTVDLSKLTPGQKKILERILNSK